MVKNIEDYILAFPAIKDSFVCSAIPNDVMVNPPEGKRFGCFLRDNKKDQ